VALLEPEVVANRSLANGTASLPPGSALAVVELGGAASNNTSGVPAPDGTENASTPNATPDAAATTLRVDGRTVLANASGLSGTYRIALHGAGPHRVSVPPGGEGRVRGIAYRERGAVLAVSADA
jgi:hypothetical protein